MAARILPSIPSEPRYEKKFVNVLGKRMAYVEYTTLSGSTDTQDTIVFVHGNPTSSYMWRNVMPHCEELKGLDGGNVRLIAPDLIGMGASEKLDNVDDPHRYSLKEQSRYFSAFLEAVNVRKRVTLVAHSWGGTLAAHWGSQQNQRENSEAVRALVILEVVYVPFPSWEHVPKKIRGGVKLMLRPPIKVCFGCCGSFDLGAFLIMKKNMMLESMSDRVNRADFGEAEMMHYRQGFEKSHSQGIESRRPILSFVRSIPVAGKPPEVVEIMDSGRGWLESSSTLPILFFSVQPGTMMQGDRDFIRGLGENVTEIEVEGGHMVTEDSPDDVGSGIAKWFREKVAVEQ
jgi:haloalkane dehalogenase